MGIRLADLIRRPVPPKLRMFRTSEGGSDRKPDGYSRALQAARVRAAHQRSYFAPALFNLVPVETTLVGSMAVDSQWRLYYNEAWLAAHSVEQNASLLVHEVSHLLRDHEGRKKAAGIRDHRRWNTAGDCEINDDLQAEGLPLPGDPPLPARYGLPNGERAETYYHQLPAPPRADDQGAIGEGQDCGSGAHGERRFWELPADDGSEGGVPGVDRIKAELVRRDVAHRIEATSIYDTDVPLAWRRWARATLAPKVDYMATLRHTVRRALRQSTLGRYDRTYRRPHRRQACYGEFIMASFHQPRPRAGFLIDTSGSMGDSQLARAVSELGGLTRQIGSGADVIVACCDAAVHDVRKAFTGRPIELYGGGGTDMGVGLRAFIERRNPPIDLLVIVSDCLSPWPADVPPFPVITVRVGEGAPPPWGNRGANRVITIEDAATTMEPDIRKRRT
jgi:predicted metal-dependent peptidase